MKELYFSIDIETDGQVPGLHSMIQLGCTTLDIETGQEMGGFCQELKPLPDAHVHKETREWWLATDKEMWRVIHRDGCNPYEVITNFANYVDDRIAHAAKVWNLASEEFVQPIVATWRPAFDMSFFRYYCHRFLGKDLIEYDGKCVDIDIKTATALALGIPLRECKVRNVPREWFGWKEGAHNHNALQDAREQGQILRKALQVLAHSKWMCTRYCR